MTTVRLAGIVAVSVAVCTVVPLRGAGPSFHPDVTFQGSSLTGWHVLGDAEWNAQNGEITGTPKRPSGGWLVLDRSYQDVGFYASFRCATTCRTGVLLRMETTPDGGMKGIYVSLDGSETAAGESS